MKAATGEEVTAEELGGGDVHTRISGVADHLAARRRRRARDRARRSSPRCRRRAPPPLARETPEPPAYDPAELYGIVAARPAQAVRRARADRAPGRRQPLPRVQGALRHRRWSPASRTCTATRSASSPTTACSSPSRRSRRRTSSSSAARAACRCSSSRTSPASSSASSYEHGGIAKDGAKMVHAVANARGAEAHGDRRRLATAPATTACAAAPTRRASSSSWPNSRISVMGGEQAAQTLLTVKLQQLAARGETHAPTEEQTRFQAPIRAKYETRGQPLLLDRAPLGRRHPRSRRDARRARARRSPRRSHAPIPRTPFGVFRM